jgi:TPR repeat protein
MYHHGKGVPQNYGEALHWYRKAADQGNVKAQYALGYLDYMGEGVPQNLNEAFNWYHKAAEQGDSKAQYALGLSFYEGRGVAQDRVESARWYRKAADQGIAQAQYCLGYMYYYGQGVPQDRAEADRWLHKAASQGDENAKLFLGLKQTKWTKTQIFVLSFKLILGISLLIGFMLPGMSLGNVRQRVITGTGVLSLLSAGLSWLSFTHVEMQQTKSILIALSLITWLLDGTLLVLLIYILGSGKKADAVPLRQR